MRLSSHPSRKSVIAALIATEKLVPWKALAMRGVMVVLLALAIGVALSPGDVPGLTLPDAQPMDGMRMQMD